MGFVVVTLGLVDGRGWSTAGKMGLAVAIGGFAGWLGYNLASRQNNGLILVSFGVVPMVNAPAFILEGSLLNLITRQLFITVPAACFIGLTSHILDRRRRTRDEKSEVSHDTA